MIHLHLVTISTQSKTYLHIIHTQKKHTDNTGIKLNITTSQYTTKLPLSCHPHN